jgi:hypothetical protein
MGGFISEEAVVLSNYTSLSVSVFTRNIKKTKLRGFSPQANYTDRATMH